MSSLRFLTPAAGVRLWGAAGVAVAPLRPFLEAAAVAAGAARASSSVESPNLPSRNLRLMSFSNRDRSVSSRLQNVTIQSGR